MTAALLATCLWLILANVLAMLPSPDHHRARAKLLIVTGIPLLGWLTWTTGPLAGLIALAAGASLLRWPLRHLWRRLRAGRARP